MSAETKYTVTNDAYMNFGVRSQGGELLRALVLRSKYQEEEGGETLYNFTYPELINHWKNRLSYVIEYEQSETTTTHSVVELIEKVGMQYLVAMGIFKVVD